MRLESDQIRGQIADNNDLQSLLQNLIEKVNQLRQAARDQKDKGLALSDEANSLLAAAPLDPAVPLRSPLRAIVDTIAATMTTIPDSLSLNDRGQAALVDLTTSTDLLWSQIDRLQDPADPVWRIVTSKANEKKWNTKFSETYFMAEGDSSVVVVRDSPMDFRVQKGENDPSALVQAQLQVSRAVGDTAIVVAGAATGINLSRAFEKRPDDAPEGEEDVSESEQIALKRALLKKQSELRIQKVRALRLKLRSIRSSLEESSEDSKAIERLLSRLKDTLNAYELAFRQKENEH